MQPEALWRSLLLSVGVAPPTGQDARIARYRTYPEEIAQAAGIALDPWQKTVLDSTAPILLINCSRQAGKSTVVALLVTRQLLTPDSVVLITSPSERQSKLLMRKVLHFWRKIGRPIPHTSVGKTILELANGSRIEALPGSADTILGFTPDLIIIDEAARADDDLYSALSPMLAVSGGRIVAPSTPKGKRGWWYELWHAQDEPDIDRVQVTAHDIPRMSKAFLDRELRLKGEWLFNEWYMCVFQEAQSAAFRAVDIDAMFQHAVPFDAELFAL